VGMRPAVAPRGPAVMRIRIKSPARTTRRGLPGPSSWQGRGRSFDLSARTAAATSDSSRSDCLTGAKPPLAFALLATSGCCGHPVREPGPIRKILPHLYVCIHSSCLTLGKGISRLRRDSPDRHRCTAVRCIFRAAGLPRPVLHFSTGVHGRRGSLRGNRKEAEGRSQRLRESERRLPMAIFALREYARISAGISPRGVLASPRTAQPAFQMR